MLRLGQQFRACRLEFPLLFFVCTKGLGQTCIDFELETEASLFSLKFVVVCRGAPSLGQKVSQSCFHRPLQTPGRCHPSSNTKLAAIQVPVNSLSLRH